MDESLNKDYRLFIENWYTSFETAHTLVHHETDVIGTQGKDGKNLPHIVKTKLNVGERVVQYEKNTNLMCNHWEVKKMSTCYPLVLRKEKLR